MLGAFLRRLFTFFAAILLVAFLVLLVHNLQDDPGYSLPVLIGGGVACLLVVLTNCWAMARADDYLIPPHTKAFFIGVAIVGGGIGLGLLGLFFFLRHDYVQSYFVYYGLVPGILGLITVLFALVRAREAYAMPAEYRSDDKVSKVLTGFFSVFSIGAIGASAVALVVVVADPAIWDVRQHAWEETEEVAPDIDSERAEEVFEMALEQRDNYRRAYPLFRQAATYGHLDAVFEIAEIYAGDGFLRDVPAAITKYEEAAERGHTEAAYVLGRIYRHGELGVEVDYEKARRFLLIAAEAGHVEAQDQLGNLYTRGEGIEPDQEEAFRWFLKAAEQGKGTAMNDVGIFLINGTGVSRDAEEGLEWLRKAADQGMAVAQFNLAQTLYYGDLVEPDREESFKYFQMLAERDIPLGHRYVGLHYLEGDGVEQDYARAMEAFEEGARRGDEIAEYWLGYGHLHGLGTERDTSLALLVLERSAEKGNADAQFLLGTIFRDGEVILGDPVEAAKWFYLAAENGNEEAQEQWEALEVQLSSSERNMVETDVQAIQGPNSDRR